MKLYRQKLFSSLGSDVVFEFLGRLSGFIHRAKTLHWSAKGKDIHEYLDGFWKELYEFQDTVAEGWMGIEGKISDPFSIPCVPADELYPMDFIREVETRVLDFYNLLPADDPRYKGLSGEVEGFIQEIEKYKYLFGLCYGEEGEKEFSEKRSKSEKLEDAVNIAGTGVAGLGLVEALRYGKAKNKLAGELKSAKDMEKTLEAGKDLKKVGKLDIKKSKIEDKINKLKAKYGEISEKDLESALKDGKYLREDTAKTLKEFNNSTVGKTLRREKRTKAALITSAGLLAAGTGLGIYNKAKKKKSNKDK